MAKQPQNTSFCGHGTLGKRSISVWSSQSVLQALVQKEIKAKTATKLAILRRKKVALDNDTMQVINLLVAAVGDFQAQTVWQSGQYYEN